MAPLSPNGDRGAPPTGPWAVALVGLLAIAYAPLLAGRLLFHRDVSRFLHPIRWFVNDSLRRGDWPWWNPHVGLGYSMLADPQAGLFYPVNLLHLVGPLPFAMMAVMFLHLGWGALGIGRAARVFGLGRVPAVVAGLTWALSGYIASAWTNGARLPSAAWIPWQVVACLGVAAAVGWRSLLRATAFMALATAGALLAGDFFVAAMGALLGPALAMVWWASQRRAGAADARRSLAAGGRNVAWLGVGSLVGLLVAMITVLPALFAVADTERASGFPFAAAAGASLHPARLTELLAPEAFARAWYRAPTEAWVGRYLDGQPLSLSIYGGGAALVLVALACGRRRAGSGGAGRGGPDVRARGTALAVAAVGAFFLLLALGRHTPLFAAWRFVLLPLRYLRGPEKYLLAVVPCLALLAGWGAQRLLDREEPFPWKAGLPVPAAALLLLATAGLLFPPVLAGELRARAWPALLAALLVGVVGWLARRRPRLGATLLVLVVAGDLIVGSRFTLASDDAEVLRKPALAEFIQPSSAPPLPFPRLFRGSKVGLFATGLAEDGGTRATIETLRENLGVPFGVAALPGYGVAIAPAQTDVLGRGRLDALRLLAVDLALLSSPAGATTARDGLTPVLAPQPDLRLYRVERALPRVYLAFAARRMPTAELSRHLLDADVVAGTTVLLADAAGEVPVAEAPAAGGTRTAVACRLDSYRTNEIVATCAADQPGVAVFVEQLARGWHATLDGVATPLLRANGMMRAVALPAGQHRIRLVFAPPGLRLGAWASWFGVCAVLALFVAARSRRGGKPAAAATPRTPSSSASH
jgi:hypothetical protein